MERERIHVMVRGEVFAKFRIVGVQYVLGVGGRDIAAPVTTCMKQQRSAAADADIADAEEWRAVGLAMALDPEQFADWLNRQTTGSKRA